MLSGFIKQNPGYTPENTAKFIELLVKNKYEIRPLVAEFLLKAENRNNGKKELIDRKFDLQLNEAVRILQ